jgi:hypothetical protein
MCRVLADCRCCNTIVTRLKCTLLAKPDALCDKQLLWHGQVSCKTTALVKLSPRRAHGTLIGLRSVGHMGQHVWRLCMATHHAPYILAFSLSPNFVLVYVVAL